MRLFLVPFSSERSIREIFRPSPSSEIHSPVSRVGSHASVEGMVRDYPELSESA